MGLGPSSHVGFLTNGKVRVDVAALNIGSISLSNLEPRLCVLLRFRICANLAETNVTIGPREGRHAGGDNDFPLLVFSVHAVKLN